MGCASLIGAKMDGVPLTANAYEYKQGRGGKLLSRVMRGYTALLGQIGLKPLGGLG